MRIVVTGGAGFIGSHLCERLLAQGHQVVCFDNFDDFYSREAKQQNLSAIAEHPGFTLVHGDIRHPGDSANALRGAAAVVHLAARPGVRPSLRDPGLYAEINVRGTIHLLEAVRHQGVEHVVLGSSSSVYGVQEGGPFDEEATPCRPASPYGASKLAAEVYCATYHRLYGTPVTCLRFFTVYGPRQRPDMAIHRFTRLIEEGRPLPVYGDGTTRRDYTYVDDVIDGIVRAVERPDGYQVYNLGNSEAVALRDLIAIIERVLGKTAVTSTEPPQPGDVPITHASIDRARRALGFRPQVKIEEGVRRFVELFRAHRTAVAAVPDGGPRGKGT